MTLLCSYFSVIFAKFCKIYTFLNGTYLQYAAKSRIATCTGILYRKWFLLQAKDKIKSQVYSMQRLLAEFADA